MNTVSAAFPGSADWNLKGTIKQELKELVRHSVEETLNNLQDQEAAELTNASRYECTEEQRVTDLDIMRETRLS